MLRDFRALATLSPAAQALGEIHGGVALASSTRTMR